MSEVEHLKPEYSELGKRSIYDATYNPDRLYPIPRNRKETNIPFYGFDFWNHYEVSWLNEKGKPQVALAIISYGCDSINIIESKSMKLYFNSFNQTQFKDLETIQHIIKTDLEARLEGGLVNVLIIPVHLFQTEKLIHQFSGICLDELDIHCSAYHVEPLFLKTENAFVEETLYSNLLKSNCLLTNQPDWCSVQIVYRGKKMNREGLLRYIVSFRNDNHFHEQCIEEIFRHLWQYCELEELTVYGRSTRRGGLDINSVRSNKPIAREAVSNMRLCRQ